jgi:transcriptional regulator with XRE-family HTH domain/tetratricopeptide (TPR) repeat protein
MFGDLLRAHRRRLGLSQEDLAGRSGVSVRGLRDLESGRTEAPRPRTVRILADALGLAGEDRERFHHAAAASPRPPAPVQLPGPPSGFTGRSAHLRRLDALLAAAADGDRAVAVVSGGAGVGKTSLVTHWAHAAGDGFPDGRLFVDLRGFGPDGAAMSPADALRVLLDGLGVPPGRIPADAAAQVALYRSALGGRRVLVVLDNARDAAQVRPLLPGAPGCAAVVTSRRELAGLVATEGATPVALGVFEPAEARTMLARRVPGDRVAAEAGSVADIIGSCGRLPLALAVVAARATARPDVALAAVAAELRQARTALDALAGPDPAADPRTAISWSYARLTDPAARLFRLLGVHPGHTAGVDAAASLAGSPVAEVLPLLRELTATHLLEEPLPGRHAFHDLVRAYAGELAADDPEAAAAARRVLDHYVQAGHAAALALTPGREPLGVEPAAPDVVVPAFAGPDAALDWFRTEADALVAALRAAAAAGLDGHVTRLAWAAENYLQRRGDWATQRATQEAALAAARRRGSPREEAVARRGLARALVWLGEHDAAETHLREARRVVGNEGDTPDVAHVELDLALLYDRSGRFAEGRECAQRAHAAFHAAGDLPGSARALNMVGWCAANAGDPAGAVAPCLAAIELHRAMADGAGEANAWDSLGVVRLLLGEGDEAAACFRRAHEGFLAAGDRYGQALALGHLGDALATGDGGPEAREAWSRALAVLEALDHPDAAELRARLAR